MSTARVLIEAASHRCGSTPDALSHTEWLWRVDSRVLVANSCADEAAVFEGLSGVLGAFFGAKALNM